MRNLDLLYGRDFIKLSCLENIEHKIFFLEICLGCFPIILWKSSFLRIFESKIWFPLHRVGWFKSSDINHRFKSSEEHLADSGSSPLKLESKYSDPSIWNLTSVDLRKNCTRRSCTKFSKAELERWGELSARPLSSVLYESQSSTPHFWTGWT